MNLSQEHQVPLHIAIVMDGNRRWAKENGLPALEGHRRVILEMLEPLLEHAAKIGVKFMTFWAWSTENWQRDKNEVEGIMKLFKQTLHDRGIRLHQKGVRVLVIGDLLKFDTSLQQGLNQLVNQTKDNTNITAVFALNYGGRDELIRAMTRVLRDKKESLTEKEFSSYLDTGGIPDPELIIRTGGEQRLSGFLLWQSEYSEFYFPTWFMPEFTPQKFDEAIEEYNRRKRRFGK